MLTPKKKQFINEYLIDLNATQAAIRAGYSKRTAGSIGQRLLKDVDVQAAIIAAKKQRQKRTKLTADEVIADLREVRDICLGRKKVKVVEVVKSEGTIKSEEVEKSVFDPIGANRALELLGKHLGIFSDRVDVTSKGQQVSCGVLLMPEVAKDDAQWEQQ